MNPQQQFCHNPACWAYGRTGEGHIVIHSRKATRYQCKRCYKTFSSTKGTALYRAHKPRQLVIWVVTLLAHGCPIQAIVAAFDLDERTVARYQSEAGAQCQRVHEHLVQAGRVELSQVQADELRVRVVGGVLWLASALVVESRLWLGGAVQAQRDRGLIRCLLERVCACGLTRTILLCTDGLASYRTQALHLFREAKRIPGRRGRPRLVLPEGVMVAQVIKRYAKRRVVEVAQRIVCGTQVAVVTRLAETQGKASAVVNTAYIERLQATFRAHLAPLVRRSRAPVRLSATLEAGMWLVGSCYNFCWPHRSLRRLHDAAANEKGASGGGHHHRWLESTPAQASGLTDHRWSVDELLSFAVPPKPLRRRGRRPKWLLEAVCAT